MKTKIIHLNHLLMSGHPSSYVEMPTTYNPRLIKEHDLRSDTNLRVLSQAEAEAVQTPVFDSFGVWHANAKRRAPDPDDEPKPAICIGPGFDRPFGDE